MEECGMSVAEFFHPFESSVEHAVDVSGVGDVTYGSVRRNVKPLVALPSVAGSVQYNVRLDVGLHACE